MQRTILLTSKSRETVIRLTPILMLRTRSRVVVSFQQKITIRALPTLTFVSTRTTLKQSGFEASEPTMVTTTEDFLLNRTKLALRNPVSPMSLLLMNASCQMTTQSARMLNFSVLRNLSFALYGSTPAQMERIIAEKAVSPANVLHFYLPNPARIS
jgi:hypothetical protein